MQMKLHRVVKLQSILVMWSGFDTQQLFVFKNSFLRKRDELKDQSDYMIPFQNAEVEECVSI